MKFFYKKSTSKWWSKLFTVFVLSGCANLTTAIDLPTNEKSNSNSGLNSDVDSKSNPIINHNTIANSNPNPIVNSNPKSNSNYYLNETELTQEQILELQKDPALEKGSNFSDEANINSDSWDPSYQGEVNQIEYKSKFFTYKTLGSTKKTHFFKDQILRNNEDNDTVTIANQKIPLTTEKVRYPKTNTAISIDANGIVNFNNSGYSNSINKTLFPNEVSRAKETIPNEWYRKILKNSVAFYFLNRSVDDKKINYDNLETTPGQKYGTGWILDYKKTEDGSYPLTWYFSTNVHVAKNLFSNQNYGDYAKASKYNNLITEKFILYKYATAGIKSSYGNKIGEYIDHNSPWWIDIDIPKAKLLYMANDYLITKPADFQAKDFDANAEEVLDFAVIEITFNTEKDARITTHDYAEKNDQQLKFRSSSYIKNPVLWKAPEFYTAGFPKIGLEKNYPIASNNKRLSETDLSWTVFHSSNKRIPLTQEIIDQGAPFSGSKWSTTFQRYEEILDLSLVLKNLNMQIYGKKHYFSGLAYAFRESAMDPGSSGSVVINKQNEIFALIFSQWQNSDIGVASALKSERYLYSNISNFYIPEYDIIYGGGADQKTSYKQALEKYLPNTKTFLFPDGFNKQNNLNFIN